jgi:hypothetical protein
MIAHETGQGVAESVTVGGQQFDEEPQEAGQFLGVWASRLTGRIAALLRTGLLPGGSVAGSLTSILSVSVIRSVSSGQIARR